MPGINIKRALGTLAFAYGKAIPKNLETKQILHNMMNANTMGTTVAMKDLAFDFPEPNTYHNKNSKVKVKFIGVGYSGSTYFYYDRVLIERSFAAPDNTLPNIPVNTTIYALLPTLNPLLKTKLTTDDIEDAPVLAGAVRLWFVAKSTSFLYIPGSKVLIGTVEPKMSGVVKVVNLPGFEPSTT